MGTGFHPLTYHQCECRLQTSLLRFHSTLSDVYCTTSSLFIDLRIYITGCYGIPQQRHSSCRTSANPRFPKAIHVRDYRHTTNNNSSQKSHVQTRTILTYHTFITALLIASGYEYASTNAPATCSIEVQHHCPHREA